MEKKFLCDPISQPNEFDMIALKYMPTVRQILHNYKISAKASLEDTPSYMLPNDIRDMLFKECNDLTFKESVWYKV